MPGAHRVQAGSAPACLREMIAGLTDEHRALAAAWRRLRPDFAELGGGTPWALDPELVDAFIGRCDRMFRREELPPMASRLLSDEERGVILAAMLARRRRKPA